MPLSQQDRCILEYALQHLESRKVELDSLIARVNSQLGVRSETVSVASSAKVPAVPKAAKKERKPRVVSEEGKAKHLAALKKRWAAYRKAKKLAQKTV